MKKISFKKNDIKKVAGITLMLAGASFSLSADNWVRIKVANDGVYGISYDELREMGFSNPSSVGIVGRGGVKLPIANEEYNILEDIVPVIHSGNTLFFYGKGPESISFNYSKSALNSGSFKNDGTNINSDFGYYYLTDASGMYKEMDEKTLGSTSNEIDWGVSFVHHEEDLFHNSTSTGNLFWGERFNYGYPNSYSWDVDLNDAVADSNATFDISFYTEKGLSGSLTFGTSAPNGTKTLNNCVSNSSNLNPLNISPYDLPVVKGTDKITVSYSSADNFKGTANLDYWTLSYRSDLSNFGEQGSRRVALPALSNNEVGFIRCEDPNGLIALDITQPRNPVKLPVNQSKTGFLVRNSGSTPIVVAFDANKQQGKISGWKKVESSPASLSLHDMSKQGASLIIIAPEWLLPYGEEIAELHRKFDDINVAVISIEDIYREFSGGLPDPEAYRRLVYNFYNNGLEKPKNLLLLGPISNNIRGIEKNNDYASHHIMPQATSINYERGAYLVIDYFVCLSDAVNISRIEREEVSMGVGTLPIKNEAEARRYINKIADYMASNAHSINLNEFLFVGGTEDAHTHDQQCVALNATLQDYTSNSLIGSVLAIDAYGEEYAKKRLHEYLGAGKGLMIYFGHSSNAMLGHSNRFFTAEEVKTLNNIYLPFLITAGCSFTDSDQGRRGIGEEWVLGTNAGAIGGIISQRETWSAQNYDFVENFMKFYTGESNNSNAQTIGEIYALTKNAVNNTNDNALTLMCDPALKIALPKNLVNLNSTGKLAAGEMVTISGEVKTAEGKTDSNFNGKVTVKLAEPSVTMVSEDFETSGKNGDVTLEVTYADAVASVSGAEIENGKFSVSLQIPSYFANFDGKDVRIYASCYDEETKKGVAGSLLATVEKASSSPSKDDTTNPRIDNMWYDSEKGVIYVDAKDDTKLNLSTGSFTAVSSVILDGNNSEHLRMVPEKIDNEGREALMYARLPLLSEGVHSVDVTISDMAGNTVQKGLVFEIGNEIENIGLSLKEKAVNGEATFLVENQSASSNIHIINPQGKTINKLKVNGNTVTWDAKDSSGNKLVPGLYKAIVIDDAVTPGIKRQSKMIFLPVV